MNKVVVVVMALVPMVSEAASFSLGAVLRAGGILQDEMFLGTTAASPSVSGNFFPFWLDSVDQNFRLSYNAATNTATLAVDWIPLITSSISWNPVGGSASSASRIWTIGAGGIAVTAVNNIFSNTSISLSGLQLVPAGLSVITPPSLTASQTGSGTATSSNTSAITFTTPTGQGSWMLSGQIRFTNVDGFGVAGDSLRAAFNISAADVVTSVPEPESLLLSALGLAALGVLHHFRGRRRARVPVVARQAGTSSKC